jgi:long-chain acyl-CoA synthetase
MSPVRNKLAPKLRFMVSGAAPMDSEIMHGFERMGIRFVQGYGLTETSPLVCVTNPYEELIGSVGYPVKDVCVTLDNVDDNGMGELLVKGQNVTLGYFENEEDTKEAFTEDGWFRTGDLATIDENSAIRIVGRAKSMIVFPNGKKAFPEEYETLLNTEDFIKESFVWGYKTDDGDVQICAKIIVNDGINPEEAVSKIEKSIKDININIPQYKIIRYFVVSKEELIKTTTLKIKRPIEEKKMAEFISYTGKDMRKLNKSII